MRTFFLLLLSLNAQAQLPIVPLQRFVSASASVFVPSNIVTGIKYWWVSSDMVTNITVTNWIDRIQQSVWTNISTATTCPTNSSLGTHFLRTSSQRLTNSVTVSLAGDGSSFDTNTQWFIVNLDTTPGFEDILTGLPASSSPTVGFSSGAPYFFQSPTLASDGTLATGKFVDVAIVSSSDSGHVNPVLTFYTNGIPSQTNTSVAIPQADGWNTLGVGGNGAYNGYIREYAVYSNKLSSVNVSNLHYYATNLYGYTP